MTEEKFLEIENLRREVYTEQSFIDSLERMKTPQRIHVHIGHIGGFDVTIKDISKYVEPKEFLDYIIVGIKNKLRENKEKYDNL